MSLTSPITTFANMRMVLKILYENESFDEDHSLDKQFIANKMNKSVAIVNNALPMLREINLASGGHRYRDKDVFLLEKGNIILGRLIWIFVGDTLSQSNNSQEKNLTSFFKSQIKWRRFIKQVQIY